MLKGMWQPQHRKKTLWVATVTLGVLALAITAALFFKEYQDIKKNPEVASKATTERIIEKVDKIYFLPANETPTVAQIEDKTKLTTQEFFKEAENGDYLLVYAEAKLALIYREQDNKLVTVGPVNTDTGKSGDVAGDQTQKP